MGILFCLTESQISENAWPAVVDALFDERGTDSLGIISFDDNRRGSSAQKIDGRLFREGLTFSESLNREKSLPGLALYSRFRASADYQEFRFIALKLLNRVDLSGTYRFLDREVIIQSCLIDILEILSRRNPELVVFEVTPHEFRPYLLMAAAGFLRIKVLFFQPCPITPAMIPLTELRENVRLAHHTVGKSGIGPQIRATARFQLEQLLAQADPRYIEIQRARDLHVRKPTRRVSAFFHAARWLFNGRFPGSVNLSGHENQSVVGRNLISIVLTRSLQKSLGRRVNRLGKRWDGAPKDYVVLALHYEPERTSLPEGLPIDYQGDALAFLRSTLPSDVTVVVKEHYSQQSTAMRGFAGRSPDFYDLVEHMPNTVFAPTSEKLSNLVGEARAVFTLTGTIAIEAVLKGTPVGYWGSPWWSGMPGTMWLEGVQDFTNIHSLVMPSVGEVFDYLDTLVSDMMIPGIASEKPEIVERKLGSLPREFFLNEAQGILEAIRQVRSS